VLERRLRVGMSQVTLHILDRAVFLDVSGGRASERLQCQIRDVNTLRKRLELFLVDWSPILRQTVKTQLKAFNLFLH